MPTATHIKLRIFVACPQELTPEKERVRLVANELNKTIADALGVVLEVVDWTTHVLPAMGRPQQVTLDQLPVETWDVFVGILWLKFGTPSGSTNPTSSEPYHSGTEEEFTVAYNLWKQNGKPKILFFRCTRPAPPNNIDTVQLERVNGFFLQFTSSGVHPGLVSNYETLEAFDKAIQTQLTRILLDYRHYTGIKKVSEDPLKEDLATLRIPVDKGFLGFFTPETNEERNRRKRQALRRETRLIRLLAHVGHSYVARVGNRFGEEVIGCLEAGAFFRLMILNPWTETGLMIAIGEADQKIEGIDFDGDRIDFSKIDIISVIQKSTYYRYSLLQVIDEYLSLKKDFGDRIELRLSSHDIPATILLTTSTGFFEPYTSVNLQQRLRHAFHTFEVQYTSECYFYHNTSTYFDTLWKMSEPYNDFDKQQVRFIERLRSMYAATI